MEVLCTTNKCMLEEQTMEELRKGEESSLYTWRPGNHTDFWGRTLDEGIKGKLGAEKPILPTAVKVKFKLIEMVGLLLM